MIEKHIAANWSIRGVYDADMMDWQRRETVKTAALDTHVPPEIQDYIDNLQPDPNCAYVHTVAMTDGGMYGSNLNGDLFSEEELLGTQSPEEAMKNPGANRGVCLPRYKTFEDAKFFQHHANSETDPFYGDVPVAAWNELMKRVELIIRIFKTPMPGMGPLCMGAPHIIAQLDARGYISVSMGCKIAYEQCTECGSTNQLVEDRCPCLANEINTIRPDGRLVAAKNFGIRMFDISKVTVPADINANSIQKVAMYNPANERVVNEAIDTIEFKSAWRKQSEMEKHTPITTGTIGEHRVAGDGTAPSAISPETMKKAFAAAGALDRLLSTATLMGIVLSPAELAQATICDEQSKHAGFDPAAGTPYEGFGTLSLDKFSPFAFNVLKDVMQARSGYHIAPHADSWAPEKLAALGLGEQAEYYAHYRCQVARLPTEQFKRAAFRQPLIRELLGTSDHDQYTRCASCRHYLASAG